MAPPPFYTYRERDFVSISASELERDDEIAYGFGGDLKYGVIQLDSVTKVRGAGILLQYVLPAGALAESSATTKIRVYWNGSVPEIHISQDMKFNDHIMILRK